MRSYWTILFFSLSISLVEMRFPLFSLDDFFCDSGPNNLIKDLLIVDYWNNRLNERLPVTYNHLLQGGYFSMPSARMGEEGEIGCGYAHIPPYLNYSLRFQMTDRLEISGNYRIFKGVEDPVLGRFGFGDFSDKGANVKIALFSPEDSRYQLPGLAFGLEDFIGTRAFKAYYLVFTQVILDYNMEISLGYGSHRIKGLFGGISWMPFRHSSNNYLKGLSFTLEYDATPYRDPFIEKHPKGRVKKTALNLGIKWRIWDSVDFSLAYIRGDALAFTASTYYNFGSTKGLLPKIEDPLPYRAPFNTQVLGELRPADVMVQDYINALEEQGFNVLEIWLGYDENCKKTLRFRLINGIYREERYVRNRLNAILAALTPDDVDRVIIVIDTDEMSIQEYHYEMVYVRSYREKEIGSYELSILTPLCEVAMPDFFNFQLLFQKRKDLWNLEILPNTHTLFGSSRGKFKYALGIAVNINGFLFNDVYYTIGLGYFAFSNLDNVDDTDRLNPSQIINVRSDLVNYFKLKAITVDEAFLEKVWAWGDGLYSRISLGLFEPEYGGISAEWLYYPVNCNWAIGAEAAILRKRVPGGIGFTDRIRKLDGFHPTYRKFIGSQYFLNVYYDWECAGLELKISGGKFLANDYGARFEITRYFPSGLRLSFWYTYTNGHDRINNETYHDKGVYFSMPLDIFYTRSSRSRWGYGMSAWLRDVGVKAYTGTELYYLINEQRQ